ncbi:MAG: YHYH protein [Pseudomonadota bacterium]
MGIVIKPLTCALGVAAIFYLTTPHSKASSEANAGAGAPFSTLDIACDITYKDYNHSAGLNSRYRWTCAGGERELSGNGVPDHSVGQFPNRSNPNTIKEQTISASAPLAPELSSSITRVGPGGAYVYALNSVKFDPATAGACPTDAIEASDCNLARGYGPWRIEALGQDVFDFGEDMNKAHVQPTGEYHYHGVPEGILVNAGISETNRKMLLVGWAGDGFPVYARYCYVDAMDPTSGVKVCKGSYTLDETPDNGRPSTEWVPLGAFTSDWNYTNGSGDLDVCNGRIGATPEFPDGIYYYMATDSYPYFSRCIKGAFEASHSPHHSTRPFDKRRR